MRKIFKINIIILALILIVYPISEHSVKGKIALINSLAMHHYKSFTN